LASTFYSQIAANRRNSFLLALVVVVLLGALGFAIGFALLAWPGLHTSPPAGISRGGSGSSCAVPRR
jgi:hypothetical protein